MTVRELFDFIKGVRPGFAFNDAQMMVWLNEIEGKVQTDIMLLDPAVGEDGTVTGLVEYDVTTDMNTELIVPFPWNKLYRYFMLMSIDLYNGEFQRYGNSFAQFNEAYEEYSAWVAQNLAPANGNAVAHGYYLTAYQFAVRGGFTGTTEEFYEVLGRLTGIEATAQAYELQSEAWAVGTKNGEDVSEEEPQYENHSKYWADKAEQSAADAGWMEFHIDEDGYLIYEHTSNVTHIDFQINTDGELEVIYA